MFGDDLIPLRGPSEKIFEFSATSDKFGLFFGKFRSELSTTLAYKYKTNIILHYTEENKNIIRTFLIGSHPLVSGAYELTGKFSKFSSIEAAIVEGLEIKLKFFAYVRDYTHNTVTSIYSNVLKPQQ